ncbi:LysR family transcriptional regulator [Pandoraea sputorum]|uniref:D-malate degradation protein R n=2 Tax=Pandoraea sputorum TaxID=93222 RepID=A0A239SJI3_9BURK|nr:LysR family transcriptional regulator [Pandoraea sputorum]SNU85551.1 D-malate degradation protein R [Pandoraea sputorum]VVE36808.1 LysR family transcriptional regulator [Pandoraea sputorum]
MSIDGFSDLRFFATLMKEGSMAAAAQQMGITPPAVSRRLAQLEHRLGVRLLHRTTRRISLTPEGDMYLQDGARILGELEALEHAVTGAQSSPRGLLRLAATLGFGRTHIAPALSAFAREYPEVEVQLHLTDRPVNLVEQGFDAAIRFGDLPDSRLTARQLMANARVLCASPAYLDASGEPAQPSDLAAHQCIVIRESDETYGTWHFRQADRQETVKVRGMLSTNDGAAATTWALNGHGMLIRSMWDIRPYLASGQLRTVMTDWTLPAADIKLVYPTKSHLSAKTRALADFLVRWFRDIAARPEC